MSPPPSPRLHQSTRRATAHVDRRPIKPRRSIRPTAFAFARIQSSVHPRYDCVDRSARSSTAFDQRMTIVVSFVVVPGAAIRYFAGLMTI